MHRANEGDIVHTLSNMRKKFTYIRPALPILLKLPRGFKQVARRGELDTRLREGIGFTVITGEKGLGVEGIDVGRSTVQEEVNDAFGFGSVVRVTRCERCGIYWCC